MRTIKNLIHPEKKVYILLRTQSVRRCFMERAEQEGIYFADGVKATGREAEDIMALKADGTICYLGWAGHMCYYYGKNAAIRIDYEKYMSGASDYQIT